MMLTCCVFSKIALFYFMQPSKGLKFPGGCSVSCSKYWFSVTGNLYYLHSVCSGGQANRSVWIITSCVPIVIWTQLYMWHCLWKVLRFLKGAESSVPLSLHQSRYWYRNDDSLMKYRNQTLCARQRATGHKTEDMHAAYFEELDPLERKHSRELFQYCIYFHFPSNTHGHGLISAESAGLHIKQA